MQGDLSHEPQMSVHLSFCQTRETKLKKLMLTFLHHMKERFIYFSDKKNGW